MKKGEEWYRSSLKIARRRSAQTQESESGRKGRVREDAEHPEPGG